jgi:hypothetical protein
MIDIYIYLDPHIGFGLPKRSFEEAGGVTVVGNVHKEDI